MPTCPKGHDSADEEYCDVCGLAMNAERPPATTAAPAASGAVPAEVALCPACDTPLDGRFCEACGHDSMVAPPQRAPAATTEQPEEPAPPRTRFWTATVSADRGYYDTVMAIGGPDADGITFPRFCPDRYFPLHGKEITIGRRSATRGITPDIDLTGPPEDPGVSHLHAMLIVGADGGLSVVDLKSSNGTTVNGSNELLRANIPEPLASGDRVHLGAWTTITVRSDG